MTAKALENLPTPLLELICDLLVDHDDDDDRTALYAFALASKTCLAAATPQRFHQIIPWSSAADPSADFTAHLSFRQRYDIRRWIELLDRYNGWRHIRCLRVAHGPDGWTDKKDVACEWDYRHDLDVDYFLRPLRTGGKPRELYLLDDTDFMALLPPFLLRATGLRDLVWASSQIPPHIVELLATQLPRCRLHMHHFQLHSLRMPLEDGPHPISDQEWALVTSPNLCTVVALHMGFDDNGNGCYLEPAVMRMIAGVAPNLQHVSLTCGQIEASLGLQEAARLGRPQWAGFYLSPASKPVAEHEDDRQLARNHVNAPEEAESIRGILRSLVLRQGVTDEGMRRYGELTDLTRLSHLTLKDTDSHALPLLTLASQARAAEFRSLTSLSLQAMDPRGSGLSALNEILENVGVLKHLCLAGFVGNDSFDIIMRRHGKTLRSLHLNPYGDFQENDEHKPSEILKMSAADVQHIADSCPHLIEIEVPVLRCHGDAREVAVYHALSRLRHLKRAWLHLYYWVVPDENASDDIPEEDMYQGWDGDDVTLPHLKDAIVDCAIDETLARSVFDIISGGTDTSDTSTSTATGHSHLRWLRLDIRRQTGRFGTPGLGSSNFDWLIGLFTRDWVVERRTGSQVVERRNDSHDASHAASSLQNASSVTVTELHVERARHAADKEWKFHEEWQYDSRQNFKTAFEELWQPDASKPEWWNDWRSFPLQVSSDWTDRKRYSDGV